MARWLIPAMGALLVGLAWLVTGWLPGAYSADLARPADPNANGWSLSRSCAPCHPGHHASWARTFHRTMTQDATPRSVVGAFDGQEVTLWGVTARPVQRAGRFFIEYLDGPGGKAAKSLEVRRTVGSRRYQQYLTPDPGPGGENWLRLPLLWHIDERRWIHLNGAFLDPDDVPYDQHLATWNQNCIFCHNTGPRPGALNLAELDQRLARGERVNPDFDVRFASTVSELGIGCESCHGPGSEHAARNRSPLRRYALHAGGTADATIVHPSRLSKERSVQLCGQCHGARVPHPDAAIRDWLTHGPPYRAGDDLLQSVRPITQDTRLAGAAEPESYRLRFWGDGTPRLTAYEMQGVTQSACYQKGELRCDSCHSMHGGDVHGQIEPRMRTNAACTGCHPAIGNDVAAHTRHQADGPGSSCYACHMPHMVFGVLTIHRSHRLEIPDPARNAGLGRPDACTSCHLDQSIGWAAAAMQRLFGARFAAAAPRRELLPDLPEVLMALLSGDPVQRAVAAERMGRGDTGTSAARRVFLVPFLLTGLLDDYPAVRWFARQSLLRLGAELTQPGPELPFLDQVRAFDYIGGADARREHSVRLLRAWRDMPKGGLPAFPAGLPLGPDLLPIREQIDKLWALQASKAIRIGE
jgi:predicted CXXCH cytochrome family protein